MNRVKAWIRSVFGFSRRETNAFLILLPLLFVVIFSEPVYQYWFVNRARSYSSEERKLDSLIATFHWEKDSAIATASVSSKKIFSFNPNVATVEELVSLGFRQSLATRIGNYRLKGGKFVVKEDLLKIYGMDSALFRNLYSYINLPEKERSANLVEKKSELRVQSKEKPALIKFDLNEADTTQLIRIYGIGPKLAQRIISYREKLGGFVSGAQLHEVYGLDSTVVNTVLSKTFIAANFTPRQININKVVEKELGAHPYVKYKLAKVIVAYRMQHGNFNSVDELQKISLIDEKTFLKMKSYLSVE